VDPERRWSFRGGLCYRPCSRLEPPEGGGSPTQPQIDRSLTQKEDDQPKDPLHERKKKKKRCSGAAAKEENDLFDLRLEGERPPTALPRKSHGR